MESQQLLHNESNEKTSEDFDIPSLNKFQTQPRSGEKK